MKFAFSVLTLSFKNRKYTEVIIMPQYKLIYSQNRGSAEVSRMLFALAGVEFEDKRLQFKEPEWTCPEWTELKSSL